MQAVVNVVDQYGNPIQGAFINVQDGDFGDVVTGETDVYGQWLSPDLPFPAASGNYFYTIYADYYSATNQARVDWYGEESLTLQLNIYEPSNYDITVVAGQGGTTDPAPGRYTGVGIIYATAIPYSGYFFDHWNLNGVFLTSNPTFHTGATGTFTAFFTGTATPPTSLDINVDPSSGTAPFTATVSGTLKVAGVPLTGESKNVWLYYSIDNQATWRFMVILPTSSSDGQYSTTLTFDVNTMPRTYYYKVKYIGD